MPSYIYVMESGVGYCKIGKSDNPEFRVKVIEGEMGISITRMQKFECAGDPLKTESEAHSTLAQSSLFREWFYIDFEDACEVARIESKSNHTKSKTAGYHKQANLFKSTHALIDQIAEVMQSKKCSKGKVSKADVIDEAVKAMHKKVVKK